jgi:hypothetical protein
MPQQESGFTPYAELNITSNINYNINCAPSWPCQRVPQSVLFKSCSYSSSLSAGRVAWMGCLACALTIQGCHVSMLVPAYSGSSIPRLTDPSCALEPLRSNPHQHCWKLVLLLYQFHEHYTDSWSCCGMRGACCHTSIARSECRRSRDSLQPGAAAAVAHGSP